MAESYNINSKIIQEAIGAGVRFFMLGVNATTLKKELSDALDDKTNIEEIFEQKSSLAKAVAVARPVIIALHIIHTLKRHFHLGYNLMVIIQQYLME